MDPLMEEVFFIENPELLENTFFDNPVKKEFNDEFPKKAEQMNKVLSKSHRHAKKTVKKKRPHMNNSKKSEY